MKRDGRDPPCTGLKLLFELLLLEIVDSNSLACGHDEQGAGRMKGSCLCDTFETFERVLSLVF